MQMDNVHFSFILHHKCCICLQFTYLDVLIITRLMTQICRKFLSVVKTFILKLVIMGCYQNTYALCFCYMKKATDIFYHHQQLN